MRALVSNLLAVVCHAIRPTVGVDRTGQPPADCAAALDGLRGAR